VAPNLQRAIVGRDINEAVMDAVALLRVPRSALGICASSRGAVTGCLLLRERAESAWLDCSQLGVEGRQICAMCLSAAGRSGTGGLITCMFASIGKQVPGDTAVIANFQYQTTAQAIIVIEKVRKEVRLDVLKRRLALSSNVPSTPCAGCCIPPAERGSFLRNGAALGPDHSERDARPQHEGFPAQSHGGFPDHTRAGYAPSNEATNA